MGIELKSMSLKSTLPKEVHDRIEEIHSLVFEIANGNYDFRLERSSENNELDGLIGGINMLGEEIKASTVSRDYLQSIYKGVVDPLIILKKDFTIETVNQQTEKQLQYDQGQLSNLHFRALVSPLHHKKLSKIEAELANSGVCTNMELDFQSGDHRKVTHSVSFSILSDKHDFSTRILVIAKDVTGFKETEKRLKEQNDALREIAWIQSHKVRGPVASLKGLMMLIDWDNKSHEENMLVVNNMRSTVDKLDLIIHEIVKKSGNLFDDTEK